MEKGNDQNIPVRYIGKRRGVPPTYMPPLGEEWDQRMEMAYQLCKSGKNMRFFIGCFKSNSRDGVMKNG